MLDLLKFDITALDRTGKVFAGLKSELGGIKGALAGVDDYARRTGRSMRNIGAGLSAAVTAPLTLLGKQSVELYDTQLQAEKTVQQAITSTGGAANRTLEELKKSASDLQGVTTFGDEDILRNVTAPLLTFTKVQDEVFDRAQANVLDMATLLKMDLKSASILVGKALNDPVKGLSALSRSGVQFSEDQKKVIQSLVETGDVAGAQALILQELETQFQGQAAAAASAPLGQMRQLSNAIGDVKEQLGEQIVPFLKPVVDAVKEGVEWFSRLNPEVKKNIVVFGGLAAAAGPVLGILGLVTIGISGLVPVIATLAGPIGLAVGAVAVLGYMAYRVAEAWDEWKARFPILQRVENIAGSLAEAWGNLPAIKWALLIPALSWARFIPGLAWAAFIPKIAWAGLAGVMKWGLLIGRLAWAALGVIPVIGWAALAGSLAWSVLVKRIEWSGWIPRVVWADWVPRINWSDWIPTVNWSEIFGGGASARDAARAAAEQNGRDVAAGMALGLRQGKTDVGAASQEIADYLRSVTEDTLGIQSPSRVFMQIGRHILEGLGIGIRENRGLALREIEALTSDLANVGGQSADFLGDLRSGAKRVFSDVLTGAQSFRSSLAGVLSGIGGKFISSGIDTLFDAIWPFANGGVLATGRVMPFASGGIVSSPTYFPMRGGTGLMGEAGPEAIMPLGRDSAGRLGVRAQGLGGAGSRSQVEVVLRTEAGVTIEQVRQISGQTAVQVSQASSAIRDRQFAGRLTDTQNRRR